MTPDPHVDARHTRVDLALLTLRCDGYYISRCSVYRGNAIKFTACRSGRDGAFVIRFRELVETDVTVTIEPVAGTGAIRSAVPSPVIQSLLAIDWIVVRDFEALSEVW